MDFTYVPRHYLCGAAVCSGHDPTTPTPAPGCGAILRVDADGIFKFVLPLGQNMCRNVWAEAQATKEEEAMPPQSFMEALGRRRNKLRQRRDWKPAPMGWQVVGPAMLAFKAPARECVERHEELWRAAATREGRRALFRFRKALEQRAPWIWIAGTKAPRINNNWLPYIRKSGEQLSDWRNRVKDLARAIKQGRRQQAHERNLDRPAWEQILLIAAKFNDVNPYAPLENHCGNCGGLSHVACNQQACAARVVVPKIPKSAPKERALGPKTCWGHEYRLHRLQRKLTIALYQGEWREARALRREKMSRVLISYPNHQVKSLKAELIQLAQQAFHEKKSIPLQGEMEAEGASAQGSAAAKTDKRSNVEIQQQEGASIGDSLPSTSSQDSFKKLSAAKSIVSDSTFHERWFTIRELNWTGSQNQGDVFLDMNIPKDILNSSNFRDSPNYALMAKHCYWRGDIEIKIIANTNVRQFGQLQFSFYYGSDLDKNYESHRSNIFSASQRLHSLLTANFSNEVIIKIPFEYIFPVMAINRVPKSDDAMHLGRLLGLVVVPLTALATCPSEASVKILCSFTNNELSGMIGRAIAEAQMLPAMASIIAVKSLLDNNRDAPTMTATGMPVIPVNSSSWCYGTGQPTYNNILRLDPRNALPYPEGRVPPLDEMKIDYLSKIFGIIHINEWSKNQAVGDLLFSWDAAPLVEMLEYPIVGEDRIVPPIGVLSSLYSYWRGSLKLRIDIVGATEITGSVLICYVPRVDKHFPLTMQQAYTCSHSIHSIRENRQIIFEVPFLASHMFWPRRSTLSSNYPVYQPPGAIFVFCYNKLIVNCAIPDNCKLIYYMSGGSDFEVAVPACPSLATTFNKIIYVPTTAITKLVPKEGYFPVYSTWWREFSIENDGVQQSEVFVELFGNDWGKPEFSIDLQKHKYWLPVLAYGSGQDAMGQFKIAGNQWPMGKGDYTVLGLWKLQSITKSPFKIKKDNSETVYESTATHVFAWQKKGSPYLYCCPMDDKMTEQAKIGLKEYYIKWNSTGTLHYFFEPCAFWLYCWVVSRTTVSPTDWYIRDFGILALSTDFWVPANFYCSLVFPLKEDVGVLGAEAGDERIATSAPIASPQDSAGSNRKAADIVFGESFLDLKDYCRRFQLYASKSLDLQNLTNKKHWRSIVMRFPVVPQGLDLDLGDDASPNEYWNRTREGPIPLILSGYRFFCGGIRFRICLNITKVASKLTNNEIKGKVFVQHRPNIVPSLNRVSIQAGETFGTDDLELPGYAAYHQFDDINNVLSVEVPFYQPCIRSYLQECNHLPLALRFGNLGEIAVGITIFDFDSIKFNYDIYYSFADDARSSVFVGFPPMQDITQISEIVPSTNVKLEVLTQIVDKELGQEPPRKEVIEKKDLIMRAETRYRELRKGQDPLAPNIVTKLRELRRLNVDKYIEVVDCMYNGEDIQDCLVGEMGLKDLLSIGRIAEKVDDQTIDNIKDISENLKEVTTELKNGSFKDKLLDYLPSIDGIQTKFTKYLDLIINAVTNLVHCLINFNLKTVVWAIISFLAQCKICCFTKLGEMKNALMKLFKVKAWRTSQELPVEDILEAQMALKDEKSEDDCALTGYVSSLIAGAAALFSFIPKFCKARKDELGDLIMTGITKFTFCANHLFTFIKNNLIAIKRIGEYFVSDHPSIKSLGPLRDNNESLYEWAKDVLEITDPRLENKVFTSTRKATEVYSLAAQANILLIDILKLGVDAKSVRVLEILCKKICDLRDRLAKVHMAPPIRFQPFMYEITGTTGIGKSEILKMLPYKLFKFMNLTHEGELIYYRNLGNQYWNNLRNQPVLTIDEKFPIDAPGFMDVQLAELFQLKSSCIFNPPMADIPDKNIRYNPIIVQYASNNAWPTITGILDADAVYRRRDCLIRVSMCEEAIAKYGEKVKYSDLTYGERNKGFGEKQSKLFPYLRFQFAQDTSEKSWTGVNNTRKLNYDEFQNTLQQKFRDFFVAEEAKYRNGLQLMRSVMPKDEGESRLENLFRYEWINNHLEMVNDEVGVVEPQLAAVKLSYDKLNFKETKSKIAKQFQLTYLELTSPGDKRIRSLADELAAGPSTARAEGDDSQNLVWKFSQCVHEAMKDILVGTNVKFDKINQTWVIKKEEFIDCVSLFIGNMKGDCAMQDSNPEKIVQSLINETKVFGNSYDDNYYRISLKSCGGDCPMGNDVDKHNFIKLYWMRNPIVHGIYLSGEKVNEWVPKFFLEKACGSPLAIEEHVKITKTWRTEIKEVLINIKNKFLPIEWRKWLKRLAIVIAVFSFMGAIVGLFKWFGSGEETSMVSVLATTGAAATGAAVRAEIGAEGHVSGDYKISRSTKKSSLPASKMIEQTLGANADFGVRNDTNIHKRLLRNTFFLSLHDGVQCNVARCLGIAGNYALMPDHYYEAWLHENKMKGMAQMTFAPIRDTTISAINFKFSDIKYFPIVDSALCLVELPLNIPKFKDIRKSFLPQKQHKNLNFKGEIVEFVKDAERFGYAHMNTQSVDFTPQRRIHVEGNKMWKSFDVHDGYEYENFNGKGRCGSVLLACGQDSPIIGMHVAGYHFSMGGVSELVYREMFDHLGEQIDPLVLTAEGEDSRYFVDSEVIAIGKVPMKFAHRERGKSRIIPSEVQLKDVMAEFKRFTEPGVLSNRDKRLLDQGLAPFSPMLEGCKHHGRPLRPFSPMWVRAAINDYKAKILANCKPVREVSLLSDDEAIRGFEGMPGYEHIDFTTSEGFPFTGFRPPNYSNKRWLFNFDKDNKYVSMNPLLQGILSNKWSQRLQNKIPATVFVDCLKDCTVSKEKVLEPGKTRIFSMSPVDFTIQQRRCTLDFSVAFMAHRRKLEHMVGCNPDSIEWTWLAHDLLDKGRYVLTGDYSKYGDSLPFEFIKGAFEIISDWYEENMDSKFSEDLKTIQQQLKIMPYEIGQSIHLMFDHLYQCVCGQPSGNSLTVIINSIANSLYLRCAWLDIMQNTQYCSLADMQKQIAIFSYGDDLIVGLSDEVCDKFNASSLHIFFSKFGLKFTNADKGTEITPYTGIYGAEFLKRKFSVHPNRKYPTIMLAPLKIESIEDTVNWVWAEAHDRDNPHCLTFREMSLQVCHDALRNAFGRGEKYYTSWGDKLQKFWRKQGVLFNFDTWEMMDKKIFDLELDLSPYNKNKNIPAVRTDLNFGERMNQVYNKEIYKHPEDIIDKITEGLFPSIINDKIDELFELDRDNILIQNRFLK